ncbi:MAG: hypothetical protein GY853_16865 [PVC group bacterium]|nr:hypothetical protein [PVC group bacterium]
MNDKDEQIKRELQSQIVEAFIRSAKTDNIDMDVVGEKVKDILNEWNEEDEK